MIRRKCISIIVLSSLLLCINWAPVIGANEIMKTHRTQHISVKLKDGKVLIIGGFDGNNAISMIEIFDPNTNSICFIGNMHEPRFVHSATLLNNGLVLIAGGFNQDFLNTAEIYNPADNTCTYTNNLNTKRDNIVATLLNDGNVLITGGDNNESDELGYMSSAEIFNPNTNEFYFTGNMDVGRVYHTATLLNNGNVLITGGLAANSYSVSYLISAELYNPTAGTFSYIGNMNICRSQHTATLLNDGRVLLTGGCIGKNAIDSAEIFEPDTNTFSLINNPMNVPRYGHKATLLNNGMVLISGGYSGSERLSSVELFNPKTNIFVKIEDMKTCRVKHDATLLPNGAILFTGGNLTDDAINSEIYFPKI